MSFLKYKLDTGMRVILSTQKDTDIFSAGIFINAGSRNESVQNSGHAHFLEHMLFKGTKKGRHVIKELDDLGADYNAETSQEYTAYHISTNSKHNKKVLDILIKLYTEPTFTKEDVESEKNVIIEELNKKYNLRASFINDMFHENYYKGTTLENNVIGTAENINKTTMENLYYFINYNYNPENTVLVVCGNFDKNKIKKFIHKKLNTFYSRFRAPRDTRTNVILCEGARMQKLIDKDNSITCLQQATQNNQTLVLITFQLEKLYYKYYNDISIISSILTVGMTSILMELLRNKHGYIYSIHSYIDGYYDIGTFHILLGCNNEKVYESVKAVLDECFFLQKNGISKELFNVQNKILKTSISTKYVNSDPRSKMEYYGSVELYNILNGRPLNPKIEKYKTKASLAKINDILKTTFVEKKLGIFVYGEIENIKKNLGTLISI